MMGLLKSNTQKDTAILVPRERRLPWFAAIGLSGLMLCEASLWLHFTEPSYLFQTHTRVDSLAFLICFSGLSLLFRGILGALTLRTTRAQVWGLFLLAFLPFLKFANMVRMNAGMGLLEFPWPNRHPVLFAGLILFLAFYCWKPIRASRAYLVLLSFSSPLWLLVAAKSILGAWSPPPSPIRATYDASTNPPPITVHSPVRVVWVIFDELDFRLTYGQRPSGLSLPNFDRMRAESLFAENAMPPAGSTLLSIPSLVRGQIAVNATMTKNGSLLLYHTNDITPAIFSRSQTIFEWASSRGLRSTIIGWYHPYADLFESDTTQVFAGHMARTGLLGKQSLGEAIRDQLLGGVPLYYRVLQIDLLKNTRDILARTLKDPKTDLIFAHLPTPHLPGIFRPDTQSFTIVPRSKISEYHGNLALADQWMGEIRQLISETSSNRETVMIVSTDHWFRASPSVDQRVPWMLWQSATHQGQVITNSFNTVITRRVVEGLLSGSASPFKLVTELQRNPNGFR